MTEQKINKETLDEALRERMRQIGSRGGKARAANNSKAKLRKIASKGGKTAARNRRRAEGKA